MVLKCAKWTHFYHILHVLSYFACLVLNWPGDIGILAVPHIGCTYCAWVQFLWDPFLGVTWLVFSAWKLIACLSDAEYLIGMSACVRVPLGLVQGMHGEMLVVLAGV